MSGSMALAVRPARENARGFDCNFGLSARDAQAFRAHGYEFCVRYVRRGELAHPYDLTRGELETILGAGLALMVVQHVESELRWSPGLAKGTQYGAAAAAHAASLGLPAGAMIWCDLEGVAVDAAEEDVIAHCTAWYDAVHAAGYLPGLYVGWHAGLGASALYHDLPFSHYWAAYNLNADECPEIRGIQMRQRVTVPAGIPPGVTQQFDVDTIITDRLGDLPVWVVLAEQP